MVPKIGLYRTRRLSTPVRHGADDISAQLLQLLPVQILPHVSNQGCQEVGGAAKSWGVVLH